MYYVSHKNIIPFCVCLLLGFKERQNKKGVQHFFQGVDLPEHTTRLKCQGRDFSKQQVQQQQADGRTVVLFMCLGLQGSVPTGVQRRQCLFGAAEGATQLFPNSNVLPPLSLEVSSKKKRYSRHWTVGLVQLPYQLCMLLRSFLVRIKGPKGPGSGELEK